MTKYTGCCFGTREDAASVLDAAAVVEPLKGDKTLFFVKQDQLSEPL